MMRCLAWFALLFASVAASAQLQGSKPILNSPHDLTAGTQSSANICEFCHVPHTAKTTVGLWGHDITPSQTYSPYASSTYTQGAVTMPAGSPSRMCLSCHDGTLGLSTTLASTTKTLSAEANLGTNLSQDHPFGFDQWLANNNLRDELFSTTPRATANASVKLWNGRIECTTCHEPHRPDIDRQRPAMFLSVDNAKGEMCRACHDFQKPAPNELANWMSSSHAKSSVDGVATTGYKTVGDGACMNCHATHKGGSERLLKLGEEKSCFTCHAVSNASGRWQTAWVGNNLPKYMHPVLNTNLHKPGEDLQSGAAQRHSECWDCHDSHGARSSGTPTAPLADSMFGATGRDKNNMATGSASFVYEVCFKCHADSVNKPQKPGYDAYGYSPVRQVDSHNVRLDFNSSVARHNVVQGLNPANNAAELALRTNMLKLDNSPGALLSAQNIECGECHNGINPSNDGGTGPNGPHISDYAHILERRYEMNVFPGAGAAVAPIPYDSDPTKGTYALCNKCHDVTGLLGTNGNSAGPKDTVFGNHGRHVIGAGISCAVCHAPHGVNSADVTRHKHSINLDTQLTGEEPSTHNWYIDTATRTCYVSCHYGSSPVKVHRAKRY